MPSPLQVVAFYTESVVGLFSVDQGRICLKQKLSQQRVQSVVRHMAVNPTHGAIAVFVEVSNPSGASRSQFQNLIIVWPTGQLQEEDRSCAPPKLGPPVTVVVVPTAGTPSSHGIVSMPLQATGGFSSGEGVLSGGICQCLSSTRLPQSVLSDSCSENS